MHSISSKPKFGNYMNTAPLLRDISLNVTIENNRILIVITVIDKQHIGRSASVKMLSRKITGDGQGPRSQGLLVEMLFIYYIFSNKFYINSIFIL